MLRGRITARQPHVKTEQRNYLVDRPISTAYYYWPPEGRGRRIVDESDYKRAVELLLRLDYSTLEKGVASTRRWVNEVGMGTRWGLEVTGKREVAAPPTNGVAAAVNNLSGLVKRKRAADAADASSVPKPPAEEPVNGLNVLGAGLVRKKRKDDTSGETPEGGHTTLDQVSEASSAATETPKVNVLSAGLVRKKPKAS